MIRLDRFLREAGVLSRSEASKAIRARRVTVDGEVVRDPSAHVDPMQSVALDGTFVVRKQFVYVMLNKPGGYVSSTEDRGPTVLELLPPEMARMGVFPCGRLDIDTTGLLLMTNDGAAAHALLSPKRHVDKTYRFVCDPPIGEDARRQLETGVDIGDCVTIPAVVAPEGEAPFTRGEITLREGKFHQIKRMFCTCGSEIVSLERIRFGALTLDPGLPRGGWRALTEDEESRLLSDIPRREK